MTNYSVPFVSNTPDDMHCLQASYAMIRQYFDPATDFDWDEWSTATGFMPGKGTWSTAGLIWFKEQGYEVVHISTFDYQEFAVKGTEYLIESLGELVGKWESEFIGDLELEKARALYFAALGVWVKRAPDLNDIRSYLDDGYLIKCLVNMNALNDKPGYLGHAVVVKGYTPTELIIHDPGLPAQPNRHVPIELFLRAWTNPETRSEKLDAIKKVAPIPSEVPAFISPEPADSAEFALS